MHCISKVKLMKFRKSCVGEFLFIAFLGDFIGCTGKFMGESLLI